MKSLKFDVGYLPRWGVLLLDLLLCTIAFWLSVWIGSSYFNYSSENLMLSIGKQFLVVMAVQLIAFICFQTYTGILRYSTFIDMVKVLMANLATGVALIAVNFCFQWTVGYHPIFNTILAIYVSIAFVLLFTLRVAVKTFGEIIQQYGKGSPRVLIYGTKYAGVAIAKMLRSAGNTPYHPVGFISDGEEPRGMDVAGLHVHPLDENLFKWMEQHNVQHVIVSPLKMREINPAKDLQLFIDHNIRILTTPYFTSLENKEKAETPQIGRIDSIRIEDLLERPQIEVSTENVRQIIEGKVVMISGAAGSIGNELVRQVQKYGPQATILVEIAESPLHDFTLDLQKQFPESRFISIIADVRDRERMEQIFNELRPDVVYHAAAYKHVPLMESYPNEAIRANVQGTKNMADMAVKYGAERFVMISTDKAVNPTNIMGASKRIAEIYVQSLFHKLQQKDPNCTKFITTRFGNVLGSNGSVIPYFQKQIAAGGPVTVTHPDIIRYFMTIPEACCLVMEASTLGQGGEIFVFDMGKPVKILDLARNMIRLAGYTPEKDIQIIFTGLRPGEKLYEELLNQKELTLPTSNNMIMIARVREFDYDKVSKQIDQLIETSHQDKAFTTVKLMKQLVPEYISKNSVYEQLDPQ